MRTNFTLSRTLDLGQLGEQSVEFDLFYMPATPDVYYLRNGDPGYPGDPEELEVIKATTATGVDITPLLDELSDSLRDALMEAVQEHIKDAREEAKYDAYRDRMDR